MSDSTDTVNEVMSRAVDRVLFHDGGTVTAEFCGESVELKPLPIKWAKKLSRTLQSVVSKFNEKNKLKAADFQKNADIEIADSLRDCVVVLGEFYQLETITPDEVESTMSLSEIKAIVMQQAKINEDDDFLLMPLQAIIGVLSAATTSARDVRDQASTTNYTQTLSGMQDSLNDGDSTSTPSASDTQEDS